MKKAKKRYAVIICISVVLIVVAVLVVRGALQRIASQAANLEISMVNLSEISNGTYLGEYSSGPVLVQVSVEINNHQIESVHILKHEKGLGGKAEAIVDEIVRSQSLEVDCVSGATVSSMCILKAVEDALMHSPN
jgi:uncharacterized protein with FMN-binding domain